MRRLLARGRRWEYTFLCLLVVANLAIHFSIIERPSSVILDEVYYITDAQAIMEQHTDNRTEHPPLGKLLVASNIALLGNNPFGWRTFPILFGTANIVLLYLICRQLRMSKKAANIATFLLTFENLSFIMGSVAMLDVFSLTFTMLSFWLYLRSDYPLSAVAIAMATLTKLTGVFAALAISLHWLATRRKAATYFLASMSLAPLSFLILMPILQLVIYRRMVDFINSIGIMMTQSASLKYGSVSHPSAIRPWEILTWPQIMPFSFEPHYYGAISFTLWALIIPTVVYMTVKAVKKDEAGLFGVLWFASTYLVWMPLFLITNRVTYVYYFYPTVGAICIGLGGGLSRLIDFWQGGWASRLRWVAIVSVVFFLVLHLGVFIVLAPVNSWPIGNLFKVS